MESISLRCWCSVSDTSVPVEIDEESKGSDVVDSVDVDVVVLAEETSPSSGHELPSWKSSFFSMELFSSESMAA